MRYRIAKLEDSLLLAKPNHLLIPDDGHRNQMTVQEIEQRMRDWLSGEYQAVIFEEEGDVLAYCLYREQLDSVYLRQLFAIRNLRRQGLGRRAIDILRSVVWPKDKISTVEVLVGNQSVVAFWRLVGYTDYALSLQILPRS